MPTKIDPRTRLHIAAFVALLCTTALVARALPVGETVAKRPPVTEAPRIEVVFVLDTTGSMSGLLEGAKRKIWSIANQMASGIPAPEIRVGLVAYRDRSDAYVTVRHDLTSDLDAVYGNLQSFHAAGGGDTPEAVNQALREAISRLSWTPSQDVYKVVFLVGDAPPHMDYGQDTPYTESLRIARRNGIVVNTVQCGQLASTTPIWREIASAGAGRYVAIQQDGGMVAVATPMDEELSSLNVALFETLVPYGAADERARLERKRSRALEAPATAAASRLSYLAKTGGRANSGRADLIDAVKEGLADVATLDDAELPEPMRALAPAERQAYVQRRLEKRETVQQRITELTRERDGWLTDTREARQAGGVNGFDTEVLETIRAQAASKGIAY